MKKKITKKKIQSRSHYSGDSISGDTTFEREERLRLGNSYQ